MFGIKFMFPEGNFVGWVIMLPNGGMDLSVDPVYQNWGTAANAEGWVTGVFPPNRVQVVAAPSGTRG